MRLPVTAEEEDAIRRILRHHGALSEALANALGELVAWVHQSEQAKSKFAKGPSPAPILSLLSTLGIYGGEAIGPSPSGPSQ
jgi:ABC-type transporter Mla subunit MlaD